MKIGFVFPDNTLEDAKREIEFSVDARLGSLAQR